MTVQEKFQLWETDTLTSYNEFTELVMNQHTKNIMIKKVMPLHEFTIHQQLANVHHKNLVEIFDCVATDNSCIILEQYIPGMTLEQYCQEKPLSESEAAYLIIQICEGLEILHGMDIIHRDITPTNIILGNDGVIKIIDYGIARTEKSDAAHDTHILGTEGFAAPEQFGFRQSDPRTDIYSVGVLMNYLLTGGKLPSEELYTDNQKLSQIIKNCIELEPRQRFDNVTLLKNMILEKNFGAYKKYSKSKQHTDFKIFPGIPGAGSKYPAVRYLSCVFFMLLFLFILFPFSISLFLDGKNFNDFLIRLFLLLMIVIIPLLFYTNFLSFQDKLFKTSTHDTKRILFVFLGLIINLIGIFLGPILT